jgi:hypothetical protein
MPSNTQNVKMGVCQVTFDGVDLGYTKGGVEVTVASETHPITVDQFGSAPINDLIMGRTCKVKVPLAETTLENLIRIMPGSTLVTAGGTKASGTVTFVTAAPVNGDKVTVNGVDFTFKTSPTAGNPNEMAIPASINAAATALAAAINASIDPLVSQVSAVAATAVVTITADNEGVTGNAVTLAKTFATGANCTVSGATLSGGVDPTQKKVVVTNSIGVSLLNLAKKLVIHPTANGPADRSDDFTVPLAMTAGALNFAYKVDQERIFDCEFMAYPASGTGNLFYVGDEAAVES